MDRFHWGGESAPSPAMFEAAPLDIHHRSFSQIAANHGLRLSVPVSPEQSPARHRVRDVYLNDPELQKLYPLGLQPVSQFHFLGWLTKHGRADQDLADTEILQFLHESAADQLRGWCLTYLLHPAWQKHFPSALTSLGWEKFRAWIHASYGELLRAPLPEKAPSDLPAAASAEGVNIISHFSNPSGIQQAALWTKEALERAGLRTSCRDVPVPRRLVPDDREQRLGQEIFPVTILTHAATPYFESGYERAGLFPWDDVYRVAYWAWELETVPDEWVEAAA